MIYIYESWLSVAPQPATSSPSDDIKYYACGETVNASDKIMPETPHEEHSKRTEKRQNHKFQFF